MGLSRVMLIAGTIVALIGVMEAAPSEPPEWSAALKRAKAEGKFVLAYFSDPECLTCQRYSAETLDNPKWASLLKRFVVVRLAMPQSTPLLRRFIPKWRDVLPVLVITDAQGKVQEFAIGHLPAETFAAYLQAFLRGERTDTIERQLRQRPNDLATLYRAAVWFLERGDGERGLPLAQKVLERDPENRKGYRAAILLHRGLFYATHRVRQAHLALDDFRTIVTQFPNSPVAEEARFYLAVTHLALGQDNEARRWLTEVAKVSKSAALKTNAEKLLRFLDREPPANLRRGDEP
jgi:tetratricopeptide (TPR) repeat protein